MAPVGVELPVVPLVVAQAAVAAVTVVEPVKPIAAACQECAAANCPPDQLRVVASVDDGGPHNTPPPPPPPLVRPPPCTRPLSQAPCSTHHDTAPQGILWLSISRRCKTSHVFRNKAMSSRIIMEFSLLMVALRIGGVFRGLQCSCLNEGTGTCVWVGSCGELSHAVVQEYFHQVRGTCMGPPVTAFTPHIPLLLLILAYLSCINAHIQGVTCTRCTFAYKSKVYV